MWSTIITLLIIVFAFAIGLKQQVERAAREEGRGREGLPEELGEPWREAARRALEETEEPSAIEGEPEVLVAAPEPRTPPPVRPAQQRVRRLTTEERKRISEPTAAGSQAAMPTAVPMTAGTLTPIQAVRGRYTRGAQVAFPRFASPLVTALVAHEILMPPLALRGEHLAHLERKL